MTDNYLPRFLSLLFCALYIATALPLFHTLLSPTVAPLAVYSGPGLSVFIYITLLRSGDRLFCSWVCFTQAINVWLLVLVKFGNGDIGTSLAVLLFVYCTVHILCYSVFKRAGVDMGSFGAWSKVFCSSVGSEASVSPGQRDMDSSEAGPPKNTLTNASVSPPSYTSIFNTGQ